MKNTSPRGKIFSPPYVDRLRAAYLQQYFPTEYTIISDLALRSSEVCVDRLSAEIISARLRSRLTDHEANRLRRLCLYEPQSMRLIRSFPGAD